MNKALLLKALGGAVTAGGAATVAFLSAQGCSVNDQLLVGGALAFFGAVFHYAKNYTSLREG